MEVQLLIIKMVLLYKNEAHIDGMYGYAAKVLDQDINVASERFGDLTDNTDFVPIGQSLWYQVFNPSVEEWVCMHK